MIGFLHNQGVVKRQQGIHRHQWRPLRVALTESTLGHPYGHRQSHAVPALEGQYDTLGAIMGMTNCEGPAAVWVPAVPDLDAGPDVRAISRCSTASAIQQMRSL